MLPLESTHVPLIDGRYRVLERLGEGGMGSVYRVHDEGTDRVLALKRLRGAGHAKQAELFAREYATLASLRHPRVVEVFDYGVDVDGPYYTMELLEGRDLSQQGTLDWRAVCAYLRDVASVLGVLHSRCLVHRDLSPRNLWQTRDGRLKLIDFGTLAPFGPASEVVGTPPFVAPEALDGRPLDPRTDLFALGALGYWLLTSVHAYRATQLRDLPQVWAREPALPSSFARLVQGANHALPAALDRLLVALLRIDPDERPRNTAEVIDSLNAIAGLKPEANDVAVAGYLESRQFVGRRHERERFANALARVNRGHAVALCVEGPEGSGRSRLLAEFATTARLSGATVVAVQAAHMARSYDGALALVRGLLAALPGEARAAAAPHAPQLAGLSPVLHALLGRPTRPAPAASGLEERAARQSSLTALLTSLARERTLVLLVDDLQAADEESQALVATLANAEGVRLLLVGAVRDESAPVQPAVRSFASAAERLSLSVLSASELRELLRSVFGEVPYLERLSARLHQLSAGVPAHAWLLVRHLVRHDIVRYADGAWTLPTDLPNDLPNTFVGSLLASLDGLSPGARRLLRVLSLHGQGELSRALLTEAAGESPGSAERAFAALVELGLLAESEQGVRLTYGALQERLRHELPRAERLRAHRVLAAQLMRAEDMPSRVHSGLHAFRAGEFDAGDRQLNAAARRIMAGEHDGFRTVAPLFAEALAVSRAAGRPESAHIALLSVLAVAGYQVDRSYAARFGDGAVALLQRSLCFDLARRVRPALGGLLSLLLALLCATVLLRWRRSGVRTREAISWLFTVLGYLMGPAAMSLDHARLRGYARVFEPLLALGKGHGVAVVHAFCQGLIVSLEDRSAAAQRHLQAVIDRLRSPRAIPGLPEANRRNLLSAAYYTFGTRETFACDDHVLITADALAEGTPMHVLQADQLRAIHFAYRGDALRAREYEQRVERKAIQLGTAWQAELIAPRHLARVAMWTFDLAAHRRATLGLRKLAEEFPSFVLAARRAEGADLVLRGQYREAIALLEVDDAAQAELGWASSQAQLAAAYNGLGQHARAEAVCKAVLARSSEAERAFVIQSLQIEVELALAEAGLAAYDDARARLHGLLLLHAQRGPLTQGYLHGAYTRVALMAGDLASAAQQLAAMDACYQPTRIPSLLNVCVELRRELDRARGVQAEPELGLAGDVHLLTRVELMMRAGEAMAHDAARTVLHVALDVTGADRGALCLPGSALPSQRQGALHAEALAWAEQLLRAAHDEQDRTAAIWERERTDDLGTRTYDGATYRVHVLWRSDGLVERPLAALLLGGEGAGPALPPEVVLRALAARDLV